jgi:hypothetical protein
MLEEEMIKEGKNLSNNTRETRSKTTALNKNKQQDVETHYKEETIEEEILDDYDNEKGLLYVPKTINDLLPVTLQQRRLQAEL